MNNQNIHGKAGGIVALAALLLVGGLTILAAPQPAHVARTTSAGMGVVLSPTTTGTRRLRALINTPAATDTPIPPTATSVPPTATPIQPTATPTPTWHTIGTYSGSASQALVTLDSTYQGDPIHLDWTCQVSQALPSWTLAFTGPLNGGGTTCDASRLSGTFNLGTDDQTSYPITIQDSAGGSWTAIVEVWY